MIFKKWCRRSGGGDNPFNHGIYYHYYIAERFLDRFKRYQATVIIKDVTYEEIGSWSNTSQLRTILYNDIWCIKGIHVTSWLREMITKGKVKMTVVHETSLEGTVNQLDSELPYMVFRFSDKGMASLFKLTFGGS